MALQTLVPNDIDSFWMPFTANRSFKKDPVLLTGADGMFYTGANGRKIIDGTAGLWCVNAGHRRPEIIEAVRKQLDQLDYAPSFQIGHPKAFELASRLSALLDGLDRIFFTNSGSESVDTALKIALAYHRARGNGGRTRLIGRERGYHGVGFGGISVGGIVKNRELFGTLLAGVDHLPHTHSLLENAFSRGQPAWGEHLADELERIVALHGASTIAAVIVEPVAGSTGVLIPPKGYLQRLRKLCTKYGILLIFDEVITGFGRLGMPFATQFFDVTPDIVSLAKGLSNGVIPMGAVAVKREIYDTFMDTAPDGIEFFHGYTYSGHPVAAAAGLATLDIYREEGLLTRAAELSNYWADAVYSLRGLPNVIDLRCIGLMAGIELSGLLDESGRRGYEVFRRCYEEGLLIRATGDILALSPPLIIEKSQIDRIFETLGRVLRASA